MVWPIWLTDASSLAVRGKRQGFDGDQAVRVSEGANERAGGWVPERDRTVLCSRGQNLAVRAEADGRSNAARARVWVAEGVR